MRDVQGAPGATLTARRRHLAVLAAVALTVLAADQGTKALALARLTEGERIPLLGDLLGLQLIHNPGAALSLASGMTWVFTVAAVGVSAVIVKVSDRLGSRAWASALGLLLGGAVGNLVDRLVRPPGIGSGHVVDFLAYGTWFIGNVADIAIVVAAGLIVLLTVLGIGMDGSRGQGAATADEAEAGPRTDPSADVELDEVEPADIEPADIEPADVEPDDPEQVLGEADRAPDAPAGHPATAEPADRDR